MKFPLAPALCAAACLATFGFPAFATDPAPMTNAKPASAVAPAGVRRTLSFTTRQEVPGTLTLGKDVTVTDNFKVQAKFAGQTAMIPCTLHLPKVGEQVHAGEAAIVTLKCEQAWQVYDNGLAFDAYVGGAKIGDGTLRP